MNWRVAMFHLGGAAETVAQGVGVSSQQLMTSGKALEKFEQMVALQSGDPHVMDDPDLLPHAKHALEVTSQNSGRVAAIDCEAVAGTACVVLGGGRETKEMPSTRRWGSCCIAKSGIR